jgi:hypothetical protein
LPTLIVGGLHMAGSCAGAVVYTQPVHLIRLQW